MPISLISYEPLSEQGLYSRDFIDDLTGNHEQYSHVIAAIGGFDTASFIIKGPRGYLDDWYEGGILRRISTYNPEGVQIWEGFVNRLAYTIGSVQKTKSIDSFYNRIYLRYSPADFSTFPPIVSPAVNLIVDNAASQALYGVKAAVISGGERVDQTAYDWARTVLKDRSERIPEGRATSTARGDAAFIEVECLGYHHVLKWLPYISSQAGSIQAQQVIQAIIQYFNGINSGWLNEDFGWMDYNFRTESRGYNSLLTCWEIIFGTNGIINRGGAGGERWVGGFYQDRKFIYKPAEDIEGLYGINFDLYRSISDPGQAIYDTALQTEVKPWDMVPDRILNTVDILDSVEYLETITFSEPHSLTWIAGDDQRLGVFLAQRGLPAI